LNVVSTVTAVNEGYVSTVTAANEGYEVTESVYVCKSAQLRACTKSNIRLSKLDKSKNSRMCGSEGAAELRNATT
jgi:hypothetical protein